MIYKGNDLIVSDDSGAIAASKSCNLSVSVQKVEIGSPEQGQWEEYIVGTKGWSLTTSHLVKATAGETKLKDLIGFVGKMVTLAFKVKGNDVDTFSGQALCTKFNVVATRGNLLTGSFSFQGTGKLE